MADVIRWMDLIYEARFRERKNRHIQTGFVTDSEPVRIAVIDTKPEPAFTAICHGERIEFFDIDGRLMRAPLCKDGSPGDDGLSLAGASLFSGEWPPDHFQAMKVAARQSRRSRTAGTALRRKDAVPGFRTLHGREFQGFLDDDRALQVASLQAMATRLRELNGAVLVPAREPVWMVRYTFGPPRIVVQAAIPEHHFVAQHAAFRADDIAGALAYAELLAATHEARQKLGREKLDVAIEGEIVASRDCRDDPRFSVVKHLVDWMSSRIGYIDLDEITVPMIVGFGSMMQSLHPEKIDVAAAVEAAMQMKAKLPYHYDSEWFSAPFADLEASTAAMGAGIEAPELSELKL
ncbi:hypothetical protein [Bosea sp. ANAM02]|uniref:hypothetical protein n=1 Tax=Bosea sp. ANAM02 TaxID=2020412 RepID=UPI00140EB8CD|nr:hypothetical protein [Bosea sp. ANAM02]BCB22553.1 hypothetical protein OCUBac02_54470 [Bosea sp. ANAM02]